MADETFTEDMLGVGDVSTLEEPTTSAESKDQTGQEGGDSSTATTTPEPQKPDLKPYTDEEVIQILESGGKLDSNRLTPIQKLIQRSFESHFTRRYQELADLKREYEAKIKEHEAKLVELSRPKTIYEAFDQDPVGVKRTLNEMLLTKEAEDPFSEDVRKLKKLKADLEIYETQKRVQESQLDKIAYENEMAVRNAIPDFDTKVDKLTDFAIKELGFTNEEISYLTDPRYVGNLASKITIAVNALYDKFNAGKTAEKKAVKPTAPSLGRAGETKEQTKPSVDIKSLSDDEFEKLIQEVKFRGRKF